ncbi:delta(3,5)-Delta(2,4)-dienoyl-CoA isomerase, mitochondrial-like [Babylonia areolata]|uniref:delta(3,5)-Delta(2,4)-dienoyl-CoA isomerase, mitochondrial-like n=1 Tax=Babylonia areolata TaxID=304850 RepID=UPI003FD21706
MSVMYTVSRGAAASRCLKKVLQANVMKRNCSSEASKQNFKTLKITRPADYVVQVELNRPDKRNAMNTDFWRDMRACFTELASDGDCRAVVLSGAGRIFTAGLDLTDNKDLKLDMLASPDIDYARKAVQLRKEIKLLQDSFNVIENCPKPVIAAVHNACVGGGIDMICACDIRYCSSDAWFSIKEVDIGITADLGTLQRLPKQIGNDSLARELAFTARKMYADEAKEIGLVSRIFSDREKLVEGAIELAKTIASKSPVAVQGSKISMNYSRDHSVQEGLEHIMTWNQGMVQSEDVMKSIMASMNKEKATFSKL